MLTVLADSGHESLPKDFRTLLKTPKIVTIERMGEGQLWYRGVKTSLSSLEDLESDHVLANFHFDGLPISSSSKQQFWPILMNLANVSNIEPMPDAIYYGPGKPPSANAYLRQFFDEMKELMTEGVTDRAEESKLPTIRTTWLQTSINVDSFFTASRKYDVSMHRCQIFRY